MLIAFKINNFLSFKEQIEFVMSASQVKGHEHHLLKGKGRNDVSILKAAVLYGANASGKSNFIKAIKFAQDVIIDGIDKQVAENKYFRLDASCATQPTQFEFEFRHKGNMYAYGVVLSLKEGKIKEEWLFRLLKTTDSPIFERKVLDNGKSEFAHEPKLDAEGKKRFDVYQKDIKDTQLFLTEINDKNIDEIDGIAPFKDAFDWLKNGLKIIFPDSRLKNINFVGKNDVHRKSMEQYLAMFKTGVEGLETLEAEANDLSSALKDQLLAELKKRKMPGIGFLQGQKARTFFQSDEGELRESRLVTQRSDVISGEKVFFDLDEESDGTRRIMDIAPVLELLANDNLTFIIDEIDRSLHPELTYLFLELLFSKIKNSESQLIVTTHESNLLDLALLRRDEIWFVEKNRQGASQLYSLEQFKPRFDKDIRKAYLQGRFGAIPFLANADSLGWSTENAE